MGKIGFEAGAKATKKTKTAAPAAAEQQPAAQKYTKAALTGSQRFQGRRDLLNALLDDGNEYTVEEAENAINNYLNKEV